MRTFALVLAAVAALAAPADAQTDAFRFDAARVPVGTVFHYLKSNQDGSAPEQIALYYAAPDRIEAFKYHPGESPAALVVATLDPGTMSASRLESWQLGSATERMLFATLDHDRATSEVVVEIPVSGLPAERLPVPALPVHVYNFDLASLGWALHHRVDPSQPFTVGLIDPRFAPEPPLFRWRGEVTIAPAAAAPADEAGVDRYSIGGEGLDGQSGWIVVDRAGGHIVEIDIPVPDHPAWQSFRLLLQRTERMDAASWQAFIEETMRAAG